MDWSNGDCRKRCHNDADGNGTRCAGRHAQGPGGHATSPVHMPGGAAIAPPQKHMIELDYCVFLDCTQRISLLSATRAAHPSCPARAWRSRPAPASSSAGATRARGMTRRPRRAAHGPAGGAQARGARGAGRGCPTARTGTGSTGALAPGGGRGGAGNGHARGRAGSAPGAHGSEKTPRGRVPAEVRPGLDNIHERPGRAHRTPLIFLRQQVDPLLQCSTYCCGRIEHERRTKMKHEEASVCYRSRTRPTRFGSRFRNHVG